MNDNDPKPDAPAQAQAKAEQKLRLEQDKRVRNPNLEADIGKQPDGCLPRVRSEAKD